MRKYLVKRLLLSVVILFFVTFIIYLLMRCMPSSYAVSYTHLTLPTNSRV